MFFIPIYDILYKFFAVGGPMYVIGNFPIMLFTNQ